MEVLRDYKEPRFRPQPIPFFVGVWYALVFSVWAVLLIAVLTTSR